MKIPKATKLPSGKWRIQLRLGGESYSVTEDTLRGAQRRAERIKAEYRVTTLQKEKALRNDSRGITVKEAAERYIEDRRAVASPATLRGYKTIMNNRFAGLWEREVTNVDRAEWQSVVNAEAKLCSAKTLKNAWSFVRSVVTQAGYQVPPVMLPQVVPAELPWLDYEQVLTFVDAVTGEPCEIPALLALHSLRRSEIMALTWDNIDLKAGTIRVEGAAVFNDDQRLIHKPENKTKASRRVVPIVIPQLTAALDAVQNKRGLVMHCNPNTIWAQINRVCRKAGLPEVGVHGLRRSFASLCYHLKLGEHETMIIGGWDDYGTVHKVYTKLAARDQRAAVEKLSGFFKNAHENAHEAENA